MHLRLLTPVCDTECFLHCVSRIRAQPLELYRYIRLQMEQGASHFLHKDANNFKGVESTPSNPLFGHVMERSWNLLFKCTTRVLCCEAPEICQPDMCQCIDTDN